MDERPEDTGHGAGARPDTHPDDARLNAHLDSGFGGDGGSGDAAALRAHLEGCTACSSRLAALVGAREALSAPVPVPSGLGNTAVAAALAAYDQDRSPVSSAAAGESPDEDQSGAVLPLERRPGRRREHQPRASEGSRRGRQRIYGAIASVAAVVVVAVAAASFSGGSGRGDRTASDLALSAPAQESATDGAAAPPTAGGDLGEIPDAPTLAARVSAARSASAAAFAAGSGPATATARASSSGPTGDASAVAAPAMPPVGTGVGASADSRAESQANTGAAASAKALADSPEQALSGSGAQPCEASVRQARPGLGNLVFVATARQQGVEAAVLGFTAVPAGGVAPGTATALTLVMVAGQDCRVLAEAVVP